MKDATERLIGAAIAHVANRDARSLYELDQAVTRYLWGREEASGEHLAAARATLAETETTDG